MQYVDLAWNADVNRLQKDFSTQLEKIEYGLYIMILRNIVNCVSVIMVLGLHSFWKLSVREALLY